MNALAVVLCCGALFASIGSAAVVQTDSSPVCNAAFPRCQAKCPQGQDYIFICSAGNGPMGGPYVLCQCVAPAAPVGPPNQVARLALTNWPGSNACNQKTWINDCTTQITVQLNGSSITFIPAVMQAFNEQCSPQQGIVIGPGPQGTKAAVVFPQYPIGVTSTGPDGSLTIDFSATAASDPNGMDWSQCIVTYRIVQGTFLNPQLGLAAQQGPYGVEQQVGQQQLTASATGDSLSAWPLQLLLAVAASLTMFWQL